MVFVEEIVQRPSMLLGIGTGRQRNALMRAGAERVFVPADFEDIFDREMIFVVFRPGDTVVMAQPNILSEKQMRQISARGVDFQVIGHEPRKVSGDDEIRELRRLKAKVKRGVVKDARGAKPKYPVPTEQQVKAIVGLWRSELKRAAVVQQVQIMMGSEVPEHWVRDQVIKATGTATRNPE